MEHTIVPINIAGENQRLDGEKVPHTGASGPIINELPFDILRDIFLLLRHEPKVKSTLMIVCRKWQWVIIQSAHFWTTIKVEGWNGYVIKDRMNYTMRSIQYAQSLDLDIRWSVAFDHGIVREGVSNTHPSVEEFLQRAPPSRWKSLSVCRYALIPEAMLSKGFPILETFTVDTTINSVPTQLLKTLDDGSKAPKLKVLELDENWRSVRPRLSNAFERISRLKLGTPTGFGNNLDLPSNIVDLHLGSTYQILGQFPHVKTLSVGYPFWGNPEFPNVTKLELRTRPGPQEPLTFHFPKLETLEVINSNPGNCLTNIVAPQLRHLSLPFWTQPGTYGMVGMGLMAKLNPNTLLPSRVLELLKEQVIEVIRFENRTILQAVSEPSWKYFPNLVSVEAKIWMSEDAGATATKPISGMKDSKMAEHAIDRREIRQWKDWAKQILKRRKNGSMEFVKCSWNDIREIIVFGENTK